MRFYTGQHRFYCGIDLHARLLAICIFDQAGSIVCQKQIAADQQLLLDTLAPFRPDVAVCVECLFAWYWVADLCAAEKIPFVLGRVVHHEPRNERNRDRPGLPAPRTNSRTPGGTTTRPSPAAPDPKNRA